MHGDLLVADLPVWVWKYPSGLSSAVLVHVQRPVHGDEGSNSGSLQVATDLYHYGLNTTYACNRTMPEWGHPAERAASATA